VIDTQKKKKIGGKFSKQKRDMAGHIDQSLKRLETRPGKFMGKD